MRPDKQTSPEKQLLKIIEDPGALKSHGAGPRKLFGKLSPGVFKARLSFLLRGRQAGDAQKRQFSIKKLNVFLWILSGVLLLALIVNFMLNKKGYDSRERLKIIQITPDAVVHVAESTLKSADDYIQLVKKRDVFRPTEAVKKDEQKEPEQKTEEKPKEPTIHDLMSGLSLVGIAWSENPDAMIEDTKDKSTYFLKEGQSLRSGIKIKKIHRERVVLEYKNEEASLE